MTPILVKIFATALVLSQVTTHPEALKTHFDPVRDQDEVAGLLSAGCAHIRKTFDIESINLDDLITTAMDDPKSVTGEVKAFHGIDFGVLQKAYRQFCKNEPMQPPAIDLGEVIGFYNQAVADLPDHTKLKGMKLPGLSEVVDAKGAPYAELFEQNQRRISVPLSDIPDYVQKAFVAAEDKRFFEHKGIDERGLIRAFVGNLTQPGRPQGGSTITQQVIKNLLVGDDVTYERKMREMIVASRVERLLSKAEILELYLNTIYLGRGSFGIEMAARSYFGKSAKALSLTEGAFLAGLTKGPNYFGPDRHPERAQERLAYVLNRMQEDGIITADRKQQASVPPTLIALDKIRPQGGFYFVDQLGREIKTLTGLDTSATATPTIHSTVQPVLQRAVEVALQEGLARYELNTGRAKFQGAEANLSEAIQQMQGEQKSKPGEAIWQRALTSTHLPLYDVHWTPAVVVDLPGGKNHGDAIRVGLSDGRVLPLTGWSAGIRRALKVYDVVYVRVADGKGNTGAHAELRARPEVQGAAVVLDNKTGRILAMTGGFSYSLSQLNRASQTERQPGSVFKPFTYLAALQEGLQPNTLVLDMPVTLPPVGGESTRESDYWSPKNYEGGTTGVTTLRRALENSRNLVTARLLDGGIENDPEQSLDRVCHIAVEAHVYSDCVRYYPFVLGAQPARLIDLAAFYAAIANEGARPAPYTVESIEQNGRVVYQHPATPLTWIGSVDRVSFYQVKSMLQGVVERGTAYPIHQLAPYVAGKTGTTENENDTWFIGFTNDVTVAVWVGYDNANNKRRTLGAGQTGAKVAIPIFTPIIQAVWDNYAPKTVLSPPSPDAERQIAALPIDLNSGDRLAGGPAFTEYFRLDTAGRIEDTQYRLVPREEAYAYRDRETGEDGEVSGGWYSDNDDRPFGPFPWPSQSRAEPPRFRGLFGEPRWWDDDPRDRQPQRRDPDYFWGNQRSY